ncbi:MAG TPA: COX15/CtaA family protein [Anaeromyxobacter sp.]|nr:COX15/CtaA family protein [Anaeromyxobacter sp.]
MREYRLAVLTAVSALALAVIGTLVDPEGAPLACPDWPLCQGEALPALTGRVLVEHGHRLVAVAVAALTIGLAVSVRRRRTDPALRGLALAAVALVVAQAALGAASVLLRLPDVARVAHLVTAMAFFALVVHLAARLRAGAAEAAARA